MSKVADAFSVHYSFTDDPVVFARTPVLSIQNVAEIYSQDSARVTDSLIRDARVAAALRVATRTLHENLNGDGAPNRGVISYLVRMAGRCTPFGLCSAVGTVNVGSEATLNLPVESVRMHVRPDMSWFSSLLDEIAASEEANQKLPLAASRLCVPRGDRLVVLNPMEVRGTMSTTTESRLDFAAVSLKNTEAVRFVREFAASPKPREAITLALAERFEETVLAAEGLVGDLCRAGLLRAATRPYPIGAGSNEFILDHIRGLGWIGESALERHLVEIQSWNGKRIDDISPQVVEGLSQGLTALHESNDLPIQIDAVRTFDGTLPRGVLEDVEILASIAMSREPAGLVDLHNAFAELYGSYQAEVPLLEVVDSLHGLDLSKDSHKTLVPEDQRRVVSDAKLQLAGEALKDNVLDLALDDQQLSNLLLRPPSYALPSSLEIGFEVLASSLEQVSCGEYAIVQALYSGSISAGRAASRFLWSLGSEATARLRELERMQEVLDQGLRHELVVETGSGFERALNVSIRPRITKRDIAIGFEACRPSQSLDASDILIGFDGVRFYARDRNTGRKISIVESYNLNVPKTAPSVGRFLSLLRTDGYLPNLGFDWGAASWMPRTPRLQHGRVILAPASWRLPKQKVIEDLRTDDTPYLKGWSVPDWVQIGTLDNRLPIDLRSPVGRDLFVANIRKSDGHFVQFEEFLSTPDRCWVQDAAGEPFRCEFIANAVRTTKEPDASRHAAIALSNGRPLFSLGSKWTYFKLYCAKEDAELILQEYFSPILESLRSSGLLQAWFFVRYWDPKYHLRVRISAPYGPWLQELTVALQRALDVREIADLVFDTYRPETERYGGPAAMTVCESIFAINSNAAMDLLGDGFLTPEVRAKLCCESSLAIVKAFSDQLPDFKPQMISSRRLKLDSLERELSKSLQSQWHNVDTSAYSRAIEELFAVTDFSVKPVTDILSSILHMHFNRFGLTIDVEERLRGVLFQAINGAMVRSASALSPA